DHRESWRRTYSENSYRSLPWFSPRASAWVRRGVEAGWIRPGSRVLDLGCGAGTNAIYLARSGFRTCGIDLAPGAIDAGRARARRAGLSIEFRVGDALQLPYERGTFGGLTDIGCFHTLPRALRPAYARELSRVLRPGGRYLLSWVAREHTEERGPPHRPSVEEVAGAFEREFQFRQVEFLPETPSSIMAYGAVLERRRQPQPLTR
ncbi:MAG TPA: class I SAM-dependent methyltransferase, partial [Thermoplasmata archaeon]|nr:class I SAM-dependent methyltransferase [Thermoplasmata archaeon]